MNASLLLLLIIKVVTAQLSKNHTAALALLNSTAKSWDEPGVLGQYGPYGGNNGGGSPFDDSGNGAIKEITVTFGDWINKICTQYASGTKCNGGSDGTSKSFTLNAGETITKVVVGEDLLFKWWGVCSLQFTTSSGRSSQRFGGDDYWGGHRCQRVSNVNLAGSLSHFWGRAGDMVDQIGFNSDGKSASEDVEGDLVDQIGPNSDGKFASENATSSDPECSNRSDCNDRGDCINGRCSCEGMFVGPQCQAEAECHDGGEWYSPGVRPRGACYPDSACSVVTSCCGTCCGYNSTGVPNGYYYTYCASQKYE